MSLSRPSQQYRTWAQVALQNIENVRPQLSGFQPDSMPPLPSKPKPSMTATQLQADLQSREDLDPNNTRIFLKLSSSTDLTLSTLFSCFRTFGKVRSISLNSKRSNAIIDFASKVRHLSIHMRKGRTELIRALQHSNLLFYAPSASEWRSRSKDSFSWLCICWM